MSKAPMFSEIIEARMQEIGMSKTELARRVGVQPPRIHALLRQINMTEDIFRRCLDALDLDFDVVERDPQSQIYETARCYHEQG